MVDDDRHLLVTVTDYLTSEGFEVKQAANGREAMNVLETWTPNLIILDIMMPEVNGLAFLKLIAGPDGSPRYPVIALTARAQLESFMKEVNVAAFLAKPCTHEELGESIREVLTRHAHPAEQARQKRLVLLAEDDVAYAERLTRYLQREGYDVDVVRNGALVLESVAAAVPDVLVMKNGLHRIKGLAMAAMVSTLPSMRNVPIVVYDSVTAGVESRFLRGEAPQGVTKYIFSDHPHEVLAAVQEALNKGRAASESAPKPAPA
jgi:DNA-binding response OmpR family regulator